MQTYPCEFDERLNSLEGKTCWWVRSGGSHNRAVRLAIGPKEPRRKPLSHPRLHGDFCAFAPEFGLLVSCPWRLDAQHAPLASSDQDPDVLLRNLEKLLGQTVLKVTAEPPAWDLTVAFTGDLTLQTFSCNVDPDALENWSLDADFGGVTIVVGPGYERRIRASNACPGDAPQGLSS